MVAYHEAGHAVVGHALGMGTIERISLLSRSQALGYVLQVPEERLLHTRQWLKDRIATLLAGRAAEEIIFGDVSTGAADDLLKATAIAEQMVMRYGMGKSHRNHVVREQAMIFSASLRSEVEAIIDEAWHKAVAIGRERRNLLEQLASALLEREALDGEEITAILGQH